ncbi:hypothetical protein KIPB_006679 [Kipferlia bialata]|uniref:Uncharacterized protein n=1 Tax=Kipferlia bialata TaxID=797122 RepID=A0A9K3CXL8_9EUKA|nr:hypothetical protein KIPB_006679 [Kipferlia bialata]|eukprot:g6679.t1
MDVSGLEQARASLEEIALFGQELEATNLERKRTHKGQMTQDVVSKAYLAEMARRRLYLQRYYSDQDNLRTREVVDIRGTESHPMLHFYERLRHLKAENTSAEYTEKEDKAKFDLKRVGQHQYKAHCEQFSHEEHKGRFMDLMTAFNMFRETRMGARILAETVGGIPLTYAEYVVGLENYIQPKHDERNGEWEKYLDYLEEYLLSFMARRYGSV